MDMRRRSKSLSEKAPKSNAELVKRRSQSTHDLHTVLLLQTCFLFSFMPVCAKKTKIN